MRIALVLACVALVVLGIVVTTFSVERSRTASDSNIDTSRQPFQDSARSAALDSQQISTEDLEKQIRDLGERVSSLAEKVDALERSSGRSPAPTPIPTEADFVDQHRTSVMRIVDEENRKREWEKAVKDTTDVATGLASKYSLPPSTLPSLREFGSQYMNRVRSILDEFQGDKWTKTRNIDSPEWAEWARQWAELKDWGRGRLTEIDGAHGGEMWDWFSQLVSGVVYHFTPQDK
jgi:hypothetical protein